MVCQVEQHLVKQEEGDACYSYIAQLYEGRRTQESQQGSDYVSDIIQGHYHNYNKSSIILALAGLIYVVSPIDFLPDFLPLGFLDDITIITWAIAKIAGELSKYSQWKNTLITHSSGSDDIEEVPYEEID